MKTTSSPDNSRRPSIIFYCVIAYVAAIMLLFLMDWPVKFFFAGNVSDNLKYLMEFARAGDAGLLPYRDIPIEYPPVSAVFLWSMAPFSANIVVYQAAFLMIMTLVSALALPGVIKLSGGETDPRRAAAAAAFYTAAIICAGPVCIVSLDYIPMALSVWSLWYAREKKPGVAGALLAAAVAAKGYPVVLAPLFFVFASDRAASKKFAISFFAWTALLISPAIILSPSGFIASFRYHAERGIEIGSVYSAALITMKSRGLAVTAVFDHGSWNVAAGAVSARMAALSGPITLALICAALAAGAATKPRDAARQSAAAAAVLLGAVLGFKVGSPQFLCWAIPFLAVCAASGGWARAAAAGLVSAAGLAAQWLFPWNMQKLVSLNPVAGKVLMTEKFALVAAYIILLTVAAGVSGKESDH